MNWNLILFNIFPYMALIIAVVVTIYRSIYRPFTISSLSSQLLENKQLYWGSISFHWGIVLILLMHLLAVIFPKSLLLWNAQPLRLYLLEFSGLALGVLVVGWAVGVGLAAADPTPHPGCHVVYGYPGVGPAIGFGDHWSNRCHRLSIWILLVCRHLHTLPAILAHSPTTPGFDHAPALDDQASRVELFHLAADFPI